MSDITKVWLLSTGEYSDYCIRAVYADEATAQAAHALYASFETSYREPNPLEVFTVSTGQPKRNMELNMQAQVAVDTGEVTGQREYEDVDWTFDGSEPSSPIDVHVSPPWPLHDVHGNQYPNPHGQTGIYVRGYDHERVRKVMSEKLAELKAEAAGLT